MESFEMLKPVMMVKIDMPVPSDIYTHFTDITFKLQQIQPSELDTQINILLADVDELEL